jgi:glycosyltransferase involved in cell wall biosynthesis
LAFESFDFSGYDLVLSLSSGFSHGVRPPPGVHHLSYCLTPPRFLWTFDSYVRLEGVGRATRLALGSAVPLLRRWDYRVAQRVDQFVAISEVVRERIQRCYGRASAIVYPSIDVNSFPLGDGVDDYFLTGGRLIPYKRVDLAIEACNQLRLPLKIVGDGRSRQSLERLAGPTIEFLGRVDDSTLRRLYSRCRAFIFPGEEDFGLTPIEAQAAGRPVIAYGRGGTRETIRAGETGEFFDEQSVDSLVATLERFDHRAYDSGCIRTFVLRKFDVSVFRARFQDVVAEVLAST